jgi:Holliday junction resolvasome RuvABC endonuclease subunit
VTGPRVLGVDLSLTSTGLCTGTHNTNAYGYSLKATATEAERLLRIRNIVAFVHVTAAARKADLVVIEDLIPGIKGASYAELVGLHYIVRYALTLNGLRYALVHNSAVKRYATGKGGGAGTDKTAIAIAVFRRFGIGHDTSDETDAWVLYAMARDHYGYPVGRPMPATHRKALAQVTWPTLQETADV